MSEFNLKAALAGIAAVLNKETASERFTVHADEANPKYPILSVKDSETESHLYLIALYGQSYYRSNKHGIAFDRHQRKHTLGYDTAWNNGRVYAEPKINVEKVLARFTETAVARKKAAEAAAAQKSDEAIREAFAAEALPALAARIDAAGFACSLTPRFSRWGTEHELVIGTQYDSRSVWKADEGTSYVPTSSDDALDVRHIDYNHRLFTCPVYIHNHITPERGNHAALTFGEGKVRPDSLDRLLAILNVLRGA